MFTRDSMVVRAWVDKIREGERALEEVPNLSNLIDIVTEIIREDD